MENSLIRSSPAVRAITVPVAIFALANDVEREKMLRDFEELRSIIGGAGASDRFAEDIVKTIKK